MELYSVKMRAWQNTREGDIHISGAERLVPKEMIAACLQSLQERAFTHEKGIPTGINLKIEMVQQSDVLHVPVLPTSLYEARTVSDGLAHMENLLFQIGIENAEDLVSMLTNVDAMRGSIVWGKRQNRRLEADQMRGVRVTYMDYAVPNVMDTIKNHYREALALASKVLYHPNVVAEICISDDPGYVTGYIATKQFGYRRISKLKEEGVARGGRVIIYDGTVENWPDCLAYLEKKKVLIDE